jgi:hypothetical protein
MAAGLLSRSVRAPDRRSAARKRVLHSSQFSRADPLTIASFPAKSTKSKGYDSVEQIQALVALKVGPEQARRGSKGPKWRASQPASNRPMKYHCPPWQQGTELHGLGSAHGDPEDPGHAVHEREHEDPLVREEGFMLRNLLHPPEVPGEAEEDESAEDAQHRERQRCPGSRRLSAATQVMDITSSPAAAQSTIRRALFQPFRTDSVNTAVTTGPGIRPQRKSEQ